MRPQHRVIKNLRWWIGGLLFASTVINYIDRQTLNVLAPYLKKEFAVDTAGPGRHRGGVGEEVVMIVPEGDQGTDLPVTTSIRGWGRSPESSYPVLGLLGGQPGRGGHLTLNNKLESQNQVFSLRSGDVIRLTTPGGGGFGIGRWKRGRER